MDIRGAKVDVAATTRVSTLRVRGGEKRSCCKKAWRRGAGGGLFAAPDFGVTLGLVSVQRQSSGGGELWLLGFGGILFDWPCFFFAPKGLFFVPAGHGPGHSVLSAAPP